MINRAWPGFLTWRDLNSISFRELTLWGIEANKLLIDQAIKNTDPFHNRLEYQKLKAMKFDFEKEYDN